MILDKFRLDGQVAVVTGGTSGIGKAIAEALAEAGADIAVVSRSPDRGIEGAVRALGRRYLHHAADLTERNQTRNVPSMILKEMGDINILVNCAGIGPRFPAEQFPEDQWDKVLEIDLTAVFLLSQAAGQFMLKAGKGKIINIASVLSFQGGINNAAYASSKHGIAGLTKALANDWAIKGINVNAIAPGYFATEFIAALMQNPERTKLILGRVPAGRFGQPVDIGGAAVFLASPASDFLHGVVLPVDGGWLSW
jgi:2-dehydro-3-deoxy-D-gluconate 5-dehydrogenase